MKRVTAIAIFLCLVTFILSCGGVKPSFIDPSFIYSAIKTEGIAILPVGGGQVDRFLRKEAGRNLGGELAEKYPKVKVISPQDTGGKLTEADLIEEYIKVVSTYQMTGTLKSDKLDKIGKVFGVRYLIIPIILRYDKKKVKGEYKYTMALEVQTFDLKKKSSVFQCKGEVKDTFSRGWAVTITTSQAVEAFPKPE